MNKGQLIVWIVYLVNIKMKFVRMPVKHVPKDNTNICQETIHVSSAMRVSTRTKKGQSIVCLAYQERTKMPLVYTIVMHVPKDNINIYRVTFPVSNAM